jgi:hypothetical protein
MEGIRMTNPERAEYLAREFFRRVWAPPHDLDAIDELMSPDYRITTAGAVIEGRSQFKTWVAQMQALIADATNEHLEIITNATGDRVVSRWVTRGRNNGMFGFPADQAEIAFTGIAIWRVEHDRLAECWVERSAFELYNRMRDTRAGQHA